MKKTKTCFVCNECGAQASKWQGQCSECGAWNTLEESRLSPPSQRTGYAGEQTQTVLHLSEIELAEHPRLTSYSSELDRVLGGGFVPGSVILMGGHPGAGKSTLLLQTLCQLAHERKALYITGEESLQQVAMRASRLGLGQPELKLAAETRLQAILDLAHQIKPEILVVDSIQVVQMDELQSAPGSVSQVKESAAALTRFAKQTQTVVILVGHVTKEGILAGPKVLEHIIDCSLLLESSQNSRYRIVRSQKNRFGAVNEVGVFAMLETGLKEVKNPSALFISQTMPAAPGTVISAIWEGTRPMLVEVQALVDSNHSGPPSRISIGVDSNRLILLLAVLHKHGGLFIADQNVFINLVGGLKVTETSLDLAMVFAMVASLKNRIIPRDWIVFGEVGLTGEIRPVASGQERVLEAAKHGFTKAIVPIANLKGAHLPKSIEVIGVSKLAEALDLLVERVVS